MEGGRRKRWAEERQDMENRKKGEGAMIEDKKTDRESRGEREKRSNNEERENRSKRREWERAKERKKEGRRLK